MTPLQARRRGVGLPVLLFAAFAAYLLFAQSALLWHDVLPFGDQAADDLLVQDARHFRLLHGNYSRFGFYHPGPWFLFVAGMGEYVFHDWTGLFRSALGAQGYALGLTQGAALAVCFRLWLLATGRTSLASLCTAIVLATMLAPLSPANPLIRSWTPYATMAAALFAATGLAGVILRGASWLPLLIFGAAQMMHGHASLLGVVPMLVAIAGLMLLCAGLLPLSAAWWAGWRARNLAAVWCSLGVAAIFAAPILADAILHWPGQWLLYWRFLGVLPPLPAWTACRLAAGFVPLAGAWLALLLLPARGLGADRLRLAGIVLFAAPAGPGLLYSWHGVDDPAHRYLLIWLTPFVGLSMAACLVYAWRVLPWPALRLAAGLAAASAALAVLSTIRPALEAGEAASPVLQASVQSWLARPPPSGDGRIELTLDRSAAAWGAAWTETVTLLAVLERAGRRDVCVSAVTWHLLFTTRNRCDILRDTIVARDRVTLWTSLGKPPAIRLDASGLAAMPEVTAGPAQPMAEAVGGGLGIGPGWSSLEPEGVWTDGGAAYLGFSPASLPDRYALTLTGRLLAPAGGQQSLIVSDDGGAVLGMLRGAGPASLTIPMRKPPDSRRVLLKLSVAHPVTPASLGIGRDSRALGFELFTAGFAGR